MPDTFVKIASVAVGSGGASSMDFTSIPQTYTDLNLVVSGRGVYSSAALVGIQLGINGGFPSATFRNIFGNSSTVSISNSSDVYAGSMTAGTSTASTFGNVSIYFPNYAGSTFKSYSSESVTENNSSSAGSVSTAMWSGLITSTTAISRITIYDGTAGQNIAQYSTATLYGILKA